MSNLKKICVSMTKNSFSSKFFYNFPKIYIFRQHENAGSEAKTIEQQRNKSTNDLIQPHLGMNLTNSNDLSNEDKRHYSTIAIREAARRSNERNKITIRQSLLENKYKQHQALNKIRYSRK